MRQEIADSAQAELNRIDGWCDDNNGKLHSGKAAALWCSLNNKAVKDEMPLTLSFREHTTKTISKARKGLQAMRAVAAKGISQVRSCTRHLSYQR